MLEFSREFRCDSRAVGRQLASERCVRSKAAHAKIIEVPSRSPDLRCDADHLEGAALTRLVSALQKGGVHPMTPLRMTYD